MNAKILGFLTAALIAAPMAANAQDVRYVYTYTGANFDSFDPPATPGNPYTTSDHLTFQLTTSAPLPPNLMAPTNGNGNFQDFPGVALVSITGSDGFQSLTVPAAEVYQNCPKGCTRGIFGYITTNSSGAITGSGIEGFRAVVSGRAFDWESSDPYVQFGTNVFDFVGTSADPQARATHFGATTSEPGKWTFAIVPEIDPASAAGGLTLLLSGLAMAMSARRSRSPERHAA